MSDCVITRRDMLGLLAGCILAGCSRISSGADANAGQLKEALLRMARRLYPHSSLRDQIYSDALTPLASTLANNPSLDKAISAGYESLNAAAGGDWLGADTELQIRALRSIETTDFFQAVRDAVRDELYHHPAVWELIGFEGSSVEYGGYVDRGFDKIDWLPED